MEFQCLTVEVTFALTAGPVVCQPTGRKRESMEGKPFKRWSFQETKIFIHCRILGDEVCK
jgi:hypothetical protein